METVIQIILIILFVLLLKVSVDVLAKLSHHKNREEKDHE